MEAVKCKVCGMVEIDDDDIVIPETTICTCVVRCNCQNMIDVTIPNYKCEPQLSMKVRDVAISAWNAIQEEDPETSFAINRQTATDKE